MRRSLLLVLFGLFFVASLAAQQISAPHTENFDGMSAGASTAPQNGWSSLGITVNIGTVTPRSAPNVARMSATANYASPLMLITPQVANLETSKITFWTRIQGGVATLAPNLIVGVMTDKTNAATFTPVQTFTTLSLVYQQFEVDFAGFGAQGPFIAFKHGISTQTRAILIDDFALETVATEPIFTVNPSSKDFGMIGVNYSSPIQNFTISNGGIGSLDLMSVSITGDDADLFHIVSQPDTYPVSLGAGQSTIVAIVFSPLSVGAKTATLVLTDNLGGKAVHNVSLSGEGFIRPDGSTCIDPLPITLPITDLATETSGAFGNDYSASWITPSSTYLNGNDLVYQFTLAEESYLSGSVSGSGSRTGIFILNQCPDPITPAPVLAKGEGINGGAFANVPLPAGNYFAIVSSTLLTSPIPFVLNLTAVPAGAPQLVVSPSSKDFGITIIGMEKTQVFTLTNTGGGSVQINSLDLTGADANQYAITIQPGAYPATIGFAQHIDVTVAFIPTMEGALTASLQIANDLGSPIPIQLDGIGIKQFEGGNGTAGNPFQIYTRGQLDQLREYLGATHTDVYFRQIADIDLGASNWSPIGVNTTPFYGNYDGNGFTISNISTNLPTTDYVALFGAITNAALNRVVILNANIVGRNFSSALVGSAVSSTITNCAVSGSVLGGNNVGGIAGSTNSTVVNGCYSGANISGVNSIGGLIGNSSSTINPATINCYATGNVHQVSAGTLAGGLMGAVFSGTVQNCYSTGTVTGPGTQLGGMIGSSLAAVSNSYYNSENTTQTDATKGLPRTTGEMTYPYAANTYVGWDFASIWGESFAASLNNGYPYLRSFGTTISNDGVTVVSPETLTVVPAIDETSPVVMALPNYANLGNLFVLGLNGSGMSDLLVAVGPGNWYGLIYFNGTWHTAQPSFIAGPGFFTFAGVDFGAKAEVIIVISENTDPTLPVELSAFNAVLTADMFVALAWVVESETNHMGYNVLRGETESLQASIQLNQSLISNGSQNGTQISYSFVDMEVEGNFTYYYWLESIDLDGSAHYHGPLSVLVGDVNPDDDVPAPPQVTMLMDAYPNPFNPSTTISYTLRTPSPVSIGIYNLKGQLIRSFEHDRALPGYYSIHWDGRDAQGRAVGSGIYYYKMISADYHAIKKMVMVK